MNRVVRIVEVGKYREGSTNLDSIHKTSGIFSRTASLGNVHIVCFSKDNFWGYVFIY